MREIRHFGQKTIMAGSLRQVAGWPSASTYSDLIRAMTGCWLDRKTSKGSQHVGAASDWSCAISKSDPARLHRTAAGVLKPARREGASDLEADRAGRQRLGADADADRHLGGLPAPRRDL